MRRSIREIRHFLLVGTIVGSIAMFSLIYLAVSYWYEDSLAEEAGYVSSNINTTVVNSLFQVMKKGWSRNDLLEFLESSKEAFSKTPYTVEIYRGELVEALFGEIEQPPPDKVVEDVFLDGRELSLRAESELRYVFPLKVRLECLKCHTNARIGEVLGVVDVKQNLGPLIKEGRRRIKLFLLLLFPVPVVGAYFVSYLLGRRIASGLSRLHSRIDQVNSINDLKLLDLEDHTFPFDELNSLHAAMKKIVEKLRGTAIDKHVMEFEIRLLEKFIITSELVQDWKEHISNLIVEINRIIETYCLFTLFVVNEEVYSLEIFWRNTPSDSVKTLFEEVIRQKLNAHPRFKDLQSLHLNHNVVLPLTHLPDLSRKDIELQTKTLFLDRPKIGGIVGIGINSIHLKDPTISLVVESILTTLLNVVGSIKAIYKYTKDLEYYATRDPLTDLFNQRVFWEMIEYEIEKASRHDMKLALMVIDIDNFKVINDIYGHIFGDRFLQGIAGTLRTIFRKEDILARYGGDEFVGILFEADESQAYHVAKRIREGVREFSLTATDGSVVRTTASIGFAIYPDHASAPKDLFIIADRMVASGKSLGKDRIMVPTYEDISDIFLGVGEKNLMIMNAIEEKRIVPYFQPILNLRSGRVEAYEALMRIMDEDSSGVLPAKEFIEIATDLGVINRMEHILMERVFMRAKEAGYKGNLFINISPKALIFSEFIPNVKRLAREYNIDPQRVTFEITERDTVKNLTLLERFVLDLKFEGFRFAIDDFGSGFSSFHYIKRFPIDYVKVEGEFIRSMAENDKGVDRAIVSSIVSFARGAGIRTVAEFVENEECMEVVRSLGIDFAQGYHVGMPAPVLST
jgi:diguanylate cyclase (GGDEF)-like protein